MWREEGGGFRMGNTCMPVWQNQYNIVKFKNKIKFKKNKIKMIMYYLRV